ncbi:MAG: glycosyltransferase family 4 protein [Gammaproteobacteria bacterium]|nr:glycosyltransferase family 4 protein [Gammaproteobacteria bacterium]
MHIAFAIFKVFPHGGVPRDLRKLVAVCLARGHRVRIYAMVWEDAPLPGAEVVLLPARGLRSHVRQRRFAARVAAHRQQHRVDLLIGMNKMPHLDVYYAADSCFELKARTQRPWAYRLTPRYRHFADFERAVFTLDARTRILTIAPHQEDAFRSVYGTPAFRFHALPPGIERNRAAYDSDQAALIRAEFGVGPSARLLLFIGSGFVKKGLDRLLVSLAALPDAVRTTTHLVVVGRDKASRFKRLASRLGVAERVFFAGGRDDVPALLQGADGLALPAEDEAAGMVILEAAVAGVPVLATANCGYAPWIAESGAGLVTPEPYDQARFNADLLCLLTSADRPAWARSGRRLGKDDSLYAMAPRAVDVLERLAAGQELRPVAFHAFHYAPGDPRYRDLVPVALACRERGMAVRVYTCIWDGEPPREVDLVRVPVAAMTMTGREARFRRWVDTAMGDTGAACAIGFDAASGMVADTLPETDLASGLPPGTGAGEIVAGTPRGALRARFDYAADDVVFVILGGDLVDQGIERLFVGVGRLPQGLRRRCRILALGRLPAGFGAGLRVLGLGEQTRVVEDGLFWRDAIEAGDVVVGLPYASAANSWAFDAMTAGRAVLTHASVSEAALVREADGGIVLETPFRQADCDRAVAELVSNADQRRDWQRNGAAYGSVSARYGRAAELARRIESLCLNRGDSQAREVGGTRAPILA